MKLSKLYQQEEILLEDVLNEGMLNNIIQKISLPVLQERGKLLYKQLQTWLKTNKKQLTAFEDSPIFAKWNAIATRIINIFSKNLPPVTTEEVDRESRKALLQLMFGLLGLVASSGTVLMGTAGVLAGGGVGVMAGLAGIITSFAILNIAI